MNQFIKLADMPIEIIEKYRDVLLQMIINFWGAYGISTALNGYLKSIKILTTLLRLFEKHLFLVKVSSPFL